MGENLRYEVCTAPALHPPTDYYDALKSPFAAMGPMARRFEKIFDAMKKIKGFPMAMNYTVNLMGNDLQLTRGHRDQEGADPRLRLRGPGRLQEEGLALQEVKGACLQRPAAATSATGVTAAWSSSPVRMR